MSLFFANSAWLWLPALGAIPVLVHLFARSNPPKYAFSSTEFLQRIIKKTARVRKPQDWLMLLLRTLAVLALLAAFLQPLLTGGNEVVGSKKTTVFVIDRSASMAGKDGSTDRFSAACQKAGELLKSGSIDEANVIWMDAVPDAAFPQPGPNTEYLRDILTRSQVKKESGGVAAAIRMAVSQLELAEGKRELVIVSDFQSAAWQDFKLETPPGVDVVKVQVGQGDQENLAVQAIFSNPVEPVVGQDVTMVCRVRNLSATPRRTTLYLESGGARQSKDLNIPAWGEAEANFLTRYAQPGLVSMTATITGDGFPDDDTRHAVVRVRDSLRVVSVAPPDGSVREGAIEVIDRVAASLEWLDHRVVNAGDWPSKAAADYLFVHAWNGDEADRFRELAATGVTVILHPASGVTHEMVRGFLGGDGGAESGVVQIESGKDQVDAAGWKAGIAPGAADARVFALFKSGEFGNPAEGAFTQRLRLGKSWPESVSRFIDYRDGVPGLLGAMPKGSAPLLIWNLPLTSERSTWANQSSFLPFMGEFLLASRARGGLVTTEVLPGGQIAWTPSEGLSPESISLVADDEVIGTETVMTGNGPRLVSEQDAAPGVYLWKIGDGVVHQQVANFPPEESDLRVMDPDEIAGGEVVDPASLMRRAALGDGVPLWPWLIAAAFLFLALEALVALWKPKPLKS